MRSRPLDGPLSQGDTEVRGPGSTSGSSPDTGGARIVKSAKDKGRGRFLWWDSRRS